MIMASAACLSVGLAFKNHENSFEQVQVPLALTDIMFAHAVLALSSVLHHMPTAKPHNILYGFLRFTILVYTICIITNVTYGILLTSD